MRSPSSLQRRSIKLSLRSSSGGVAGGSAPTKDWCGQFEEVRGRQRRHKPARSGSSWLSAAVAAAAILIGAVWPGSAHAAKVLGEPDVGGFPTVEVHIDLESEAWTGGTGTVDFAGGPDAALVAAIDEARDLLEEADKAGKPLDWPQPPEPPETSAAVAVAAFSDRQAQDQGLLVAFLIDASASMNLGRSGAWKEDEKAPFYRVVSGIRAVLPKLGPADRVLLARVAGGLEVLVASTARHNAVIDGLEAFDFESRHSRIFDALADLVELELPKSERPTLPGRRIVFLFSDGRDKGSSLQPAQFGDKFASLAAPPRVFAVGVGGSSSDHKDLQQIAFATGKRSQNFLDGPEPGAVAGAFEAALEPLRRQVTARFEVPLYFRETGTRSAILALEPAGGSALRLPLDVFVGDVPTADADSRRAYIQALEDNRRRVDEHGAAAESRDKWVVWGTAGGVALLLLLMLLFVVGRQRARQRARAEAAQREALADVQRQLESRMEDHEDARRAAAEEAEVRSREQAEERAHAAADTARNPLMSMLVVDGPMKGQRFAVLRSPCVLGREIERVDLAFPNEGGDLSISRVHAELRMNEQGWTLTALSSGHTAVSGVVLRKNDKYPVRVGDQLELGKSTLELSPP